MIENIIVDLMLAITGFIVGSLHEIRKRTLKRLEELEKYQG